MLCIDDPIVDNLYEINNHETTLNNVVENNYLIADTIIDRNIVSELMFNENCVKDIQNLNICDSNSNVAYEFTNTNFINQSKIFEITELNTNDHTFDKIAYNQSNHICCNDTYTIDNFDHHNHCFDIDLINNNKEAIDNNSIINEIRSKDSSWQKFYRFRHFF